MIKLDKYHKHEALDRTHMLQESVNLFLLEHPYMQQNPRVRLCIERASEQLSAAYQLIGTSDD